MTSPLWAPSQEEISKTNIYSFLNWLRENTEWNFEDYDALYKWSVTHTEDFWRSIAMYFDIEELKGDYPVLSGDKMPFFKWFQGAELNYAKYVFRKSNADYPAIIYTGERQEIQSLSWSELENRVARFQEFLRSQGVGKGDHVVGYMANIPHASIAFLATVGLGAVWSCCSPDFGSESVVDRFFQLDPKILVAVDGYSYNNKIYDKRSEVREIRQRLPTVTKIVWTNNVDTQLSNKENEIGWQEAIQNENHKIETVSVPFDHPLWVLFSSGTTGKPKAIVHGHGNNLLEHFKYHAFHNDTRYGERFFWYTTTGWMMWNYLHASWLLGATIVLYDGSPALSSLDVLWDFAEKAKINHFGTSAPYLVACMKRGITPSRHDLSSLRSIGSTGAPLPPAAFDYVYEKIKNRVWLCSMSGGTDVCTAFVGGLPTAPVYRGEIQTRALGCALEAWDEMGNPVVNEVGEMVIVKPMPSMPVKFLNDPENRRYLSSYFEMYDGIWRHGDWVKINEDGGLVILGRSDATLNRHGIRIGTSEIYNALNKLSFIKDSLIVNIEKQDGGHFMPLFVQLEEGLLTEERSTQIKTTLRQDCSPRHVPDEIIVVEDIPRTISGKKMEAPVKKLLMGISIEKAVNQDAMQNPETIDFFMRYAKEKDLLS